MAVAQLQLEAQRPGSALRIPLDRVNRLRQGDVVHLTASGADLEKSRAALLVLTGKQELHVLDAVKANAPAQWTLPVDPAAVAVAFGPKGFDSGRMKTLVSKDGDLISQLAAYSEKTAQTELLLKALESGSTGDRAFDGALKGLASTPGGTALNRSASMDQQTLAMLRALNPALHGYDPLATDQKQRWQQSATLASSVAGLFYGNYIGLAGGGAALMLNLRGMMFPRTELRSALLRGNTLCAAAKDAPRSRLGFLWARRLPGGDPPVLAPAGLAHAPAGMTGAIRFDVPGEQIAAAARAYRWRLVNAAGKAFEVQVTAPAAEKSLRIADVPEPGLYTLEADWDWTPLRIPNALETHALPDLRDVRLSPDSADRLVMGNGPVRLRLEGAPLFFLDAAAWKKAGDALAKPVAIPFAVAPDGASAELEIDTTGAAHAPYELTLTQRGGSRATLAVLMQLPPPVLEGLPLPAYRGERQAIVLRGQGVERIESIASANAHTEWRREERTLIVEPTAGTSLELRVEGRNQPIVLTNALEIQAPRTRIVSVVKAAQPAGPVERRPNEIDAAQPLSFSLQFEGGGGEVEVACQGGAKIEGVETRPIGAGSVYVTVPAIRGGCELAAALGGSRPEAIGTVVALPHIDAFTLSDEEAGPQRYRGQLKGRQLERIARTGWTPDLPVDAAELPAPASDGQRMNIVMPWPAPRPHAPLLVWLRGETLPRRTTARF